MLYNYQCKNKECKEYEKTKEVELSIYVVGTKPVLCEKCNSEMQRIYSNPGIKTSDGYKS